MKAKVNQGNGSLKLDFSKNRGHIIFQQKNNLIPTKLTVGCLGSCIYFSTTVGKHICLEAHWESDPKPNFPFGTSGKYSINPGLINEYYEPNL